MQDMLEVCFCFKAWADKYKEPELRHKPQGADPRSSLALVRYVKHAHLDSKKTRLDTWSGPILSC